jgi:uncharacterized phage infection (PIP) family protein YhgE
MLKKLVLLGFLSFSLVLLSGYLYLSEKIIEGDVKIAEGIKQIKEGEQMLTEGKKRLASGKNQLSKARRANGVVNGAFRSIPLINIAKKLPISGNVLNIANKKIADGSQKIAAGESKVRSGEQQLAEGKLELELGKKRLYQVNIIRIACGIGALIFSILFLVFLFYWKQSLIKWIKR